MRIRDWSSDVCSADLRHAGLHARHQTRSWLGQRHHAALVPLIIFCLPFFPSRQMIPSGSTSLYLRRFFAKKRTTSSYTCFASGRSRTLWDPCGSHSHTCTAPSTLCTPDPACVYPASLDAQPRVPVRCSEGGTL